MESLEKSQRKNNSRHELEQKATDNLEELSVNNGVQRKSIRTLDSVEIYEEKAILEINGCNNEQNTFTEKPPQVIYKFSSKTKNRIPKKAKYYKQAINLKKSNKKNNLRRINKQLEMFINEKVAILGKDTNKTLNESLSKITSSCPMLKQVPAKESLLEDPNVAIENIDENNGNHTPSLGSTNSTISNFSQKTITLKMDMETSESLNNVSCNFAIKNDEKNVEHNPSLSSVNSTTSNFSQKTITLINDTETSGILNDLNLDIKNNDENNSSHTPSFTSANSTASNFNQKSITLEMDTETPKSFNVDGDSEITPVDQPIKQKCIVIAKAQVDNITFDAMKSVDTLIDQPDSTKNTDSRFIPREITPYSITIKTLSQSPNQAAFFASSVPKCEPSDDENKKVQPFTEDNYPVESKKFYGNGGSVMFFINQPIKPNVINIARAQVDNISFGSMKNFDTLIDEQDLNNNTDMEYIPRESTPYCISIETLGHSSEQRSFFTSSEASSVTLVEENKKVRQSTDNSNCFNQSDASSLLQSDITLQMEHLNIKEPSKPYSKVSSPKTKRSLMDTVHDLGMFPEIAHQRSVHNFRDFIVTERVLTNFNPLIKGLKETNEGQINDSNVKPIKGGVKSFDSSKLEELLNIPAMEDISKLNEKCDTNTRIEKRRNGNPSSLPELWEKLADALDLKVQKLEESLKTTILSEIKDSFYILEKFKKLFEAKKESQIIDIERNFNKLINKLDEDLQCNLMIEPAKPKRTDIALSSAFKEDTKGVQYKLEPSFEILKPVVKPTEDSQDYIRIMVDKTFTSREPRGYRREPPLAAIRYFFKENFIVLAGAPAFLGTIVCIYFIVILIVNWV